MFQGLRAARRPDENDVVAYRLIRFSRGNFLFLFLNNDPIMIWAYFANIPMF